MAKRFVNMVMQQKYNAREVYEQSGTSNDIDNCNHLNNIQKIPEQHTGKARYDWKELQKKTAILGTAHCGKC